MCALADKTANGIRTSGTVLKLGQQGASAEDNWRSIFPLHLLDALTRRGNKERGVIHGRH